MKINDSFIIGVVTGTVLTALLTYLLSSTSIPVREIYTPGSYKDVGGNIDIEYYLEVSEDSIWIENYHTHRVYGGKYSDLDSLILKDNL